MGFAYATLEQHSRGFFKSALLPLTTAVLALIVGLSPFYPAGPVQAQKETGVVIANGEATLKSGFKFRRVSSSKLEVVQESTDAAKRAAVVVAGTLECGCSDPKTDLFIFCDTVVINGKASCGASTRCTCAPYAVGK